jgi:hypothetical protein
MNSISLSFLSFGLKLFCFIYCFSLHVQHFVEKYQLWLIFMVIGCGQVYNMWEGDYRSCPNFVFLA